MRAIQHVFRRGDTYWWRRRVTKSSGERVRQPIAASLRTREPATARMIAARLTLTSEQILSQESCNMLSKAQVRSLLATTVSDHLQKLNRIAAIELADGIEPDDGRRFDLVTGWALRLKAARGDHATVDANDHAAILGSGLSVEDFDEIDKTIGSLRQQHRTTPRAKIIRMLEDCGASQSSGDLAEAERLLHRGQAAALMAVDHRWSGRYDEDDRLVEQVLAGEAQQYVALKASYKDGVGASKAAVQPASGERLSPPPAPAETEPSVAKEPVSVLELADRLITEKAKLKEWRQKTQDQVRAVAQLFVKMLGADDVALVNQARVADYRTLLLNLPKTYGKNPKDFDRPLQELLDEAKTLPPEKVGRQGTTLNRHLTQLKAIIEYIESSGVAVGDYKGVKRLRARTEMRARDERAPFSPADWPAPIG